MDVVITHSYFTLLFKSFSQKGGLFDRLWIFITFFVFRGREMAFVNFHTSQNILERTFVIFTQLGLNWIWCHLRKREDRIFSNYSDFCRLGNKSYEIQKEISTFSSTKIGLFPYSKNWCQLLNLSSHHIAIMYCMLRWSFQDPESFPH